MYSGLRVFYMDENMILRTYLLAVKLFAPASTLGPVTGQVVMKWGVQVLRLVLDPATSPAPCQTLDPTSRPAWVGTFLASGASPTCSTVPPSTAPAWRTPVACPRTPTAAPSSKTRRRSSNTSTDRPAPRYSNPNPFLSLLLCLFCLSHTMVLDVSISVTRGNTPSVGGAYYFTGNAFSLVY